MDNELLLWMLMLSLDVICCFQLSWPSYSYKLVKILSLCVCVCLDARHKS